MNSIELKYGCNPNQKPSMIKMKDGSDLPLKVLSGRPGYINFLDALNGWQLVSELKEATGYPAATSFKHVSPAGAAIGTELSDLDKKVFFVEGKELSPLACAYARARGADRMSSYGDFVALSDVCDKETAALIAREVSDGVIAPGYTEEALEILMKKRKGNYNVIEIDPNYVPALEEDKDVFGITFVQGHNNYKLDNSIFDKMVTEIKEIPEQAKRDLLIAMITLKYTQSNSVCYAFEGQAIGIGAGQQSRIHCVRLAGNKADIWFLRRSPKVLSLDFKDHVARADRDNAIDVYLSDGWEDLLETDAGKAVFNTRPEPFTREEKKAYLKTISGVSLGSDAFFPFSDNIDRANKSGVSYIAEPGGSIRDDVVIDACNKYGIAMTFTGMRLFHH